MNSLGGVEADFAPHEIQDAATLLAAAGWTIPAKSRLAPIATQAIDLPPSPQIAPAIPVAALPASTSILCGNSAPTPSTQPALPPVPPQSSIVVSPPAAIVPAAMPPIPAHRRKQTFPPMQPPPVPAYRQTRPVAPIPASDRNRAPLGAATSDRVLTQLRPSSKLDRLAATQRAVARCDRILAHPAVFALLLAWMLAGGAIVIFRWTPYLMHKLYPPKSVPTATATPKPSATPSAKPAATTPTVPVPAIPIPSPRQ